MGRGSFLEEYRRRSLVLGKAVAFTRDGGERRALAVGIGENGELIVRYDDGREEALNAGEVRHPAGRVLDGDWPLPAPSTFWQAGA